MNRNKGTEIGADSVILVTGMDCMNRATTCRRSWLFYPKSIRTRRRLIADLNRAVLLGKGPYGHNVRKLKNHNIIADSTAAIKRGFIYNKIYIRFMSFV